MRFRDVLAMAEQQGGGAPAGGAVIGHELVTNGDYSSSTGHTLTNMTITAGHCSGAGAATQTDQVTSIETLVVGTYRVIIAVNNTDGAGGPVSATVGGASGPILNSDSPGFNLSVDIPVASVSNQLLILSAGTSVIDIGSWSCSRIS